VRRALSTLAAAAPLLAGAVHAQDAPSLVATPDRVEIGEPFTLAVELADAAALDAGVPDVDASWVVLDRAVEPLGSGVRFTWELASLEAGARLVGLLPGEDLASVPAPVRVRVASVLGPEETDPRPVRGLPDDFGRVEPSAAGWPAWALVVAGVAGGLALAGLAARLVLRRRRGPAPAPAPTRLERLEALQAVADTRERYHGWAGLLREGVDARTGIVRAARVEEDWVADDARLARELHARVAAFLCAARQVRFGGEPRSAFAEEADAREVRALLVALEEPASAAVVDGGGRAA